MTEGVCISTGVDPGVIVSVLVVGGTGREMDVVVGPAGMDPRSVVEAGDSWETELVMDIVEG